MAYSDNQNKLGAPDKTKHKPFYYSTVYGVDKEKGTPYMTRLAFYRLRLHIFHRGDADPDCHDHPWGFWTFPLVSYIEEVLDHATGKTRINIVPAFRFTYRPATYAHRVLYSQYTLGGSSALMHREEYRYAMSKKIITFVFAEQPYRTWGFWKKRDERLCWQYWKDYIFNGGKNAACGAAVRGDVANARGDLFITETENLLSGVMMVTPYQATVAKPYGWLKVRPDAAGDRVEIWRK